MKKIALSAAAFALAAGSAFAAMPVSGAVQSYDPAARVITFASGKTVAIASDVAIPANLGAGSHATVQMNDAGDTGIVVLSR